MQDVFGLLGDLYITIEAVWAAAMGSLGATRGCEACTIEGCEHVSCLLSVAMYAMWHSFLLWF